VYPFGHAVHDEDPVVAEYVPTGHFVHVLLFAGEYVPAGQVSHTAYNITSCDIFHVIFVLFPTVHDSPVPSFFVFHPFCTLPDFLHTDDVNVKEFPYIGVVPRYQSIAKQGYRAIICKQNILFYKINEETKEIILNIIVSSKRNYLNLV
jgi:hypothetical protein